MLKYEMKTLSELSTDGKGHYGIAAPAVEYSESLPTYLRITDINDDGTIDYSGLKSVSDDNASDFFLKSNDIVFARTGASTGRNYFYDGTDGKFVYAGFLIKFSIDEKKVNPRYVKYYCMSKSYRDWVSSFSSGSTRGNINAQTYGNMPILLPSRPQQDFLVKVLSALDDKIELNNQINKNLEEQANRIVKEYCQSVSSNVRLSKILSFVNGFAFQSKSYVANGRYRVITIKNVKDGEIDSNGAPFVDCLPISMKQECILGIGDVLVSLTGNVGRVGIVYESDLLLNQRVAKIVPYDMNLLPFLYFYFRMESTKISLETIAKGTAQQNLSTIETLKLELPYNDSIKEMSKRLKFLFETIVTNQRQNKVLSELRETLLPKLMSGEIDVDNVEI